MKKILNYCLLLIALSSNGVYSQYWQKIDSVFSASGVGVSSFSSPFMFDYDQDGYKDLFLGSTESEVKFYRCKSNGALPPTFSANFDLLDQIYANGYQYTNSYYPIVVDIDNDFINELIISGYNGLLLYKNTGDYNNPEWVKIDSVFAVVNTLIGTDAKPAFVDIDGDNDLDLFVGIGESLFGGPTSGTTKGFRNIGKIDSPQFVEDIEMVAGLPDAGYNSYPTFADLDNDGDNDLLIGRDLSTFLYYKNTGSRTSPVWTQNTTLFGIVESSTYWKNPQLTDIDNDGDYDLLYGTADGVLKYYQNYGSASDPKFTLKNDYFQLIKNDGNGATISTADFDQDGDFDFVSGSWLGKFNYYKNNGTKYEPNFIKSTSSFTALSVSSYSFPVFVDLQNDNDIDLVSGALNGKLTCYLNNNNVFSPNTTMFSQFSVYGFSSPAFVDIDNDNDQDLLLCSETASESAFYRNDEGTYVVDNSLISGVSFSYSSRPTFADVDNDGDFDLVYGKSTGVLVYYENKGTITEPSWELNNEIFNGIKVKQNASPGFADFDGDTKKDLLIAEYDGNFSMYKNLFALTDVKENNPIIPTTIDISNYPNPFNPTTTFQFSLTEASMVSLTIYNSLGEMVCNLTKDIYPAGINKLHFDSNLYCLSSGIYLYSFEYSSITNNAIKGFTSGKIVLMK